MKFPLIASEKNNAAGMYVEGGYWSLVRFQRVKSPTRDELVQLTHSIARRVGRFLERRGLFEPDTENSTLALDSVDDDPVWRARPVLSCNGASVTAALPTR